MSYPKKAKLKEPKNLSPRIKWLRDYYYQGVKREWNNEFTAWSTGTPWDVLYDEMSFYIVPENYPFFQTFRSSYKQMAQNVVLDQSFWSWSLVERRAWFNREVMINYLPQEILPFDLLAGARFNVQTSRCWNEEESKQRDKMVLSKNGVREKVKWFHGHGYGNSGATSGHLIPNYPQILRSGWKGIYTDLQSKYDNLSVLEKGGQKGAQLRAMMTAATIPRDLALKYSQLALKQANSCQDSVRKGELQSMARNLDRGGPFEGAQTFWEALQSLWLSHMLVMSDENYPGPGVSFGRFDQYLFPYFQYSMENGLDREFAKELLKCFWIHCNTAYDAMIRTGGNQGITSGFGQLITLSGVGKDGLDMTNELTYLILEVIDEMSPILEPKPNIRLHKNSPKKLLDKIVSMISSSQGAPFLLNFDERSMAGMLLEAKKGGYTHLINKDNVFDYAPVGCLENTMAGNDRSGTVDNNLNLLKAVELALTGGKDLLPYIDPITQAKERIKQIGPKTPKVSSLNNFEQFFDAYTIQTKHLIKKCVELYELSESIRSEFCPTPYLSCLVKGCSEKALDVTQGGAEINFTTIEGVTFATTVDSLLAIKFLVFDQKVCSLEQLVAALKDNWKGHEILKAKAKFKAPKYGQDDDLADKMAQRVMDLWCEETWKYKTKSTKRQFRPGMLSWNYWASDGYVLPASPDGRLKGQFLSNAICPSNGADINGPTANVNSVGKVLGGRGKKDGEGEFCDYYNCLPNGASHTITFNPAILSNLEHKDKFISFLKGYGENGGTALQINILDPQMLHEAQKHPEDYAHLLVRVTGYNAYFASIGRELQDELIARISHPQF